MPPTARVQTHSRLLSINYVLGDGLFGFCRDYERMGMQVASMAASALRKIIDNSSHKHDEWVKPDELGELVTAEKDAGKLNGIQVCVRIFIDNYVCYLQHNTGIDYQRVA